MEEYFVAIFHILRMGLLCPNCGGPLGLLCQYDRRPILNGVREEMPIQRVVCKKCGKTHAVLPDFILPYKHYGTAEVERVLDEADAGVAGEKIDTIADVSTVRRWCREFRNKVGGFSVRLRHIASTIFNQPVYALPPPGASGVLSQLRDSLRFLPEILSCGLVLGKVFQWFTIAFTT
ncbi:MAG TPA: DUF6431 domain-containing protein [Spirochaetia bacterium]|nr:DUF6431 domain-containing protein [Spirochaetia bacterium]